MVLSSMARMARPRGTTHVARPVWHSLLFWDTACRQAVTTSQSRCTLCRSLSLCFSCRSNLADCSPTLCLSSWRIIFSSLVSVSEKKSKRDSKYLERRQGHVKKFREHILKSMPSFCTIHVSMNFLKSPIHMSFQTFYTKKKNHLRKIILYIEKEKIPICYFGFSMPTRAKVRIWKLSSSPTYLWQGFTNLSPHHLLLSECILARRCNLEQKQDSSAATLKLDTGTSSSI